MKLGVKVQIRPSFELIEMRLMPLSFRTGTVVEIRSNSFGEEMGCWVALDGDPYLDETEWYIPINSLQYE